MLLREPMPKIRTILFELSVGTKGDLYGYRVVLIFLGNIPLHTKKLKIGN